MMAQRESTLQGIENGITEVAAKFAYLKGALFAISLQKDGIDLNNPIIYQAFLEGVLGVLHPPPPKPPPPRRDPRFPPP